MSQITLLLEQAHGGDEAAWQQVVALLYDDLLRLARCANTSGKANTLNATALVHECYLRIAGSGGENGIGNRSHFLALAGRAMRQILVNHARDRMAANQVQAPSSIVPDGEPAPDKDGILLDLEDIRLQVGDLLQLQGVAADAPRHAVKLLGYAKGRSVMVTPPMVTNCTVVP